MTRPLDLEQTQPSLHLHRLHHTRRTLNASSIQGTEDREIDPGIRKTRVSHLRTYASAPLHLLPFEPCRSPTQFTFPDLGLTSILASSRVLPG